ncbi:hypothetical protein EMIHUDRAFT_203957 [Emiliania huxleyi CCMP1516]|uniref:Uncharacterized protein n=2 Tax=Emiliania huxleyi TaxID=2903 RepID=A0A0D3K0Q0_EMIH1|nr:hypothetical protein EMIHUDRAFT_203957 [Emiliania huxleyi CCMP1516]EOD29335.1 hypothetical protein EMIHUDRAFT_203957 [Emiliania huxleyi CCMP1516]|eukprot:XP_005781764.1 hypothetical protein EMIHUDRAFT_203957 [Emiliania huxleyi CCMP1516]
MFNRPGGGLFARRRLVAVADAWLVRRVEEFDLSQAVGVGGLTAAAGNRDSLCQLPAASGGAALEEAAAWEAKQMEAARHAKELLLAEVERLSAARAEGKKGKKKKKNVDVGDTGAARLNEEMLCS